MFGLGGLAARLTISDFPAVSQGATSGAGKGQGQPGLPFPCLPLPPAVLLVAQLKRQLLCGLCALCLAAVLCGVRALRPERGAPVNTMSQSEAEILSQTHLETEGLGPRIGGWSHSWCKRAIVIEWSLT